MTAIIETVGLRKTYGSNGLAVEAVRSVDIAVEAGEFVALVGPSGCGKSSLLHMIGAMDRPSEGDVLFEGRSLAHLSERELCELRTRRIGFVFQTFNLLPTLSALENVEMPMRLARFGRQARRARAAELLDRVGLGDRAGHRPSRMSGGERQRVAVARALANSPSLVLADEPTGNLDSATGAGILDLLRLVCMDGGRTLVMVTHDREAASRADRIVSMLDGRITQSTPSRTAATRTALTVSLGGGAL